MEADSVTEAPNFPRHSLRTAAAVLLGLTGFVPAPAASQDDPVTVDFGMYIQPRYTHDFPEEGDSEGNFSVRRARGIVTGEAFDRVTYRIMGEFAGGSARLMDGWVATNFGSVTLTGGQGKIPFGRQWLTSSSRFQFVDRSIAMLRFNPDRSPGVWASGFLGGDVFEYSAGLFNGDGVNNGNVNGDLAEVARVVWTPFGAYPLAESALDFPEEPLLALGAGVLNLATNDEDDPTEEALRFNVEAAFKLRGLSAQAEFFTEELEAADEDDDLTTNAWYAQAGYLLESGYELAGRYGAVSPDVPGGVLDETELAVAASRYFEGHNLKIQADYTVIQRELADQSDGQLRVQLQLLF
jgi:phosphate-selective porin OprO/OprP